MKNYHNYHIVDQSPWPITVSSSFFFMMIGFILWFHFANITLFMVNFFFMNSIALFWWRDVIRESTYQGNHGSFVIKGIKIGMIFFIISEILFFFSFFWTYFHSALSPSFEIGSIWPPSYILPFNPMEIPLLNTSILLASGVSVTWAHYSILQKNMKLSLWAMQITITLGLLFTLMQIFEYISSSFSMSDSIYGSSFFMMTGFHGLHVIIGTLFLIITTFRISLFQFSSSHHVGFELSAWYWHFVDVVWLFLYSSIYWWGS